MNLNCDLLLELTLNAQLIYRELLSEFLRSASNILSKRGEIHVALCEGQGGASAKTMEEWRGSWTAATYAANCGLLLMDVFHYEVRVNTLFLSQAYLGY